MVEEETIDDHQQADPVNVVRHSCESRKMEREEGSSENGRDLHVETASVCNCTSYTLKNNSDTLAQRDLDTV